MISPSIKSSINSYIHMMEFYRNFSMYRQLLRVLDSFLEYNLENYVSIDIIFPPEVSFKYLKFIYELNESYHSMVHKLSGSLKGTHFIYHLVEWKLVFRLAETGDSQNPYFKRYYKKMIKPFPEKEIMQMKELEKAALEEKHNIEAAESRVYNKIELKPLTIKQKEMEYLNNKKKASFNESLKRLKYIFKLYISELKRFDSHSNNDAYIRLLAINILINIDNLYCAIEIFPENIIYNYFKFIFYMNEVFSNKRTILKKLGLSAHYRCNTSELAWFILQNELYHKKDYKYYYDILEKRMNNRLDHDNYLEILKYRKYVEAEAEGGERRVQKLISSMKKEDRGRNKKLNEHN